MRTLQGLPHDLGIADALEAVISAAARQLHDRIYNIGYIIGVDEMRHAKFSRHRFSLGIDINTDNFIRTHHASTLYDIQTDSTQAKHNDIAASFHLGGIDDCANAGGYSAADVTHFIKRSIFTNLCQCYFRYDRVIGESGCSHVMQ